MAVTIYSFRNPAGVTTRPLRYYRCDTLAERPSTGLLAGDLAVALDNNKLYKATGTTTWAEVGGGGVGGGATLLSELDDVDDALAVTNGHFLVADGTDWSNRALLEADIPATIATNAEVTTAISTHAGEADPHTGYQKESEKGAASGYASLNGSTKVVEDPANATATATASKIPIADGSGKLDTWISDASTTTKGKVELATDGESAANLAVQANDGRLTNARTPTTHSITGAEHSFPGGTTTFLRADGSFATVTATETNTGSFAPGDFTVATGTWRLQMDTLEIGAAETVEVEGTGTLAVS